MVYKAFYHEVIRPTLNLRDRAAENICVEPDYNDVISLAKHAAFAAYHFREPALRKSSKDKLPPMSDPRAEALRQRLGDVVDSAKHGPLKKPERDTTFRASIAFEYDETAGFRFLRTKIIVKNERSGTFDLFDTLIEFIPHLATELKVTWNLEEIKTQPEPFSEWAETYLTPKSGFELLSVGISIYQKDESGVLIPVDLPEIKFRVVKL